MTTTENGAGTSAVPGERVGVRGWSFPSETFPAYPRVALDAPEHWEPIAAPDAVLALGEPEPSPPAFRTNLVVSVTRFSPDYTLDRAVSDLESRIARLRESRTANSLGITLGGRTAHVREVAFVHPRAGTVLQAHLMLVLDRGAVRDLVHATASCGGNRAKDEITTIRATLKSLQLEI